MTRTLSKQDLLLLYSELGNAVANSVACGEPNIVANLVWHLPKAVANLPPLAGNKISAGGVFVHARPLVKCVDFPCNKPKSVEMGDLLLLRTEVNSKKVVERRAILFQAKMALGFAEKPDNKNQYYLYASWPEFQYVRSSAKLNGAKRHIKGANRQDISRYLLINKFLCYGLQKRDSCANKLPCRCMSGRPSDCIDMPPRGSVFCKPRIMPSVPPCCMYTALPSHPFAKYMLCNSRCFILELIDFLFGDLGRKFKTPSTVSDIGWNRVIEDLINVTAKLPSVFMERSSKGQSSGRGAGMYFLAGAQRNLENTTLEDLWKEILRVDPNANMIGEKMPDVQHKWSRASKHNGGISMIEFVVSNEG